MPAKLLIVDDDVRICRLLERYLKSQGFQVSCATNGTSMWKLRNKNQPELIILDLVLPDIDGITLTWKLRLEDPNIGIIILTAKNEIMDTIVGLNFGADDYVTKPFDKRVLLARINSVLRRVSNSVNESNYHILLQYSLFMSYE